VGTCFVISALICLAREDVWTEIKSPHFVVISDASPKQARQTARSLEQFRVLLRTCLPQLQADPGVPLLVFATRDERSLKALLPIRQGKGVAQPDGLFMSDPERNWVALRLDLPEDRAYHTIYHEYVHMIMRLNFPKMPLWLNEGLAELFAFAKLSAGESSLGYCSPAHLQVLQTESMMPLATLFAVGRDSPYYIQADKARIFYAQSWALVHYLMLGDKEARANELTEFLKLIRSGASDEAAAGKAFGDLGLLQQNLNSYVLMNTFYHYQIPAHLSMKEEDYAARLLPPAESLALRGQFLLSSNRLEDARAMLKQALRLDPQSAEANEGMGLLFLRLRNQEEARKYFLATTQLDSKSFLAQYYAAQSEYQRGADYAITENYLRKALELNAKFVPAVSMLSYIFSMQKKLPEALQMAAKAVELEPAEIRHRMDVCEILLSMEKFDDAMREAERALALADTDANRSTAQSMLSRIRNYRNHVLESRPLK
jgi:tetratricopeptide (TPR) repeat protein